MASFELHERLALDCILVKDLQLCKLLLMNDSTFPWCLLVPMREGVREIYELSNEDQILLMQESSLLSAAMMEYFQGEKMNVAALGNIVPQLHIHIIARKKDDIAWPQPVWLAGSGIPYQQKIQERKVAELAEKLKS